MTGPVDRDRQVEHLLRQSMSVGGSASSACIEAERLAAWSAGGLRREDAALVERHVAECAHCQAILAAFVESEPTTTGAASFWQRWSMRWLVPAAAASAAVLVWALVTQETVEPPDAPTTMARVEEAQPLTLPSTVTPGEGQQAVPAAPAPQRNADSSAAAARSAVPAAELVEATRGRARLETDAGAQSESNSPADSVAQSANGAGPAERSFRATSPLSAPAGLNAATVPAEPAPVVVIQSTVGADTRTWRIDPDGRVSRSSDGGATWAIVSMEPAAFITAGSASSGVCWLVGRAGVVLRSIDGVTFERRLFPEAVTLTGVQAQDARRAIVRAIDGRAFTTTDGGATWRLGP